MELWCRVGFWEFICSPNSCSLILRGICCWRWNRSDSCPLNPLPGLHHHYRLSCQHCTPKTLPSIIPWSWYFITAWVTDTWGTPCIPVVILDSFDLADELSCVRYVPCSFIQVKLMLTILLHLSLDTVSTLCLIIVFICESEWKREGGRWT